MLRAEFYFNHVIGRYDEAQACCDGIVGVIAGISGTRRPRPYKGEVAH